MSTEEKSIVIVLGASSNPEKYSYQAVKKLNEHGFTVIPVHPSGIPVHETETKKSLSDIASKVDTISIYVNSFVSSKETEKILNLKPRRIIFNPGSENQTLENMCLKNNIEVIHGCTLVMLKTNAF